MTLALQPYRKAKTRFARTWRTTRSQTQSQTSTSPVIATKYDGGMRQYVPTTKLGGSTANRATPAAHNPTPRTAASRNTRIRPAPAEARATSDPNTAPHSGKATQGTTA